MKIYVSSKIKHAEFWRGWRDNGINIISTWIDEDENVENHEDLAIRCIKESAEADITVVYVDEGDVLKGALIEVGSALSHDKQVWIVRNKNSDTNFKKTFLSHPMVTEFDSIQDIYNKLRNL